MKFKRLLSLLLVVIMVISVPLSTSAETVTTVIACSDFQSPDGNQAGAATVRGLLTSMRSYGITSADGFFCCGDYNIDSGNTAAGITALKGALSDVVTNNMVFVQGNHDEAVSARVGLSQSGNNDTENYGVFVIHEDDYPWQLSSERTVKATAQRLINYLNQKLATGYTKPIFVLSHLPLHYSMRTRLDGDAQYANYFFDALNEAGKKGLNIFYMYGHDHSNGWDDYLGGAAVYLKKGDSILIAQKSQTQFASKTLAFTYVNAGYVGYYKDHNGGDTALTMTSFKITDSEVEIARYNKISRHNLKSAGVRNTYKNESGYSPNTTVYTSPQTVTLNKTIDSTPIKNIIDMPDANKTEGEKFVKITKASDLKDGGKYLLVSTSPYTNIMIPKVVTKSTGSSTSRRGFDLVASDGYTVNEFFMDNTADKLWTFTKNSDGWLIGDDEKYIKFTDTSNMSVVASLETKGETFTVSSSSGVFNFAGGGYVLNYNSRGLINGFASNPASFYVYEHIGNTVVVQGGTTDKALAMPGDDVTITAGPAPEGKVFDKWVYVTGSGYIGDVNSEKATITMPDTAVNVKATYKDKPHVHSFGDYVSDNNATTEKDGTKTRTCSTCGEKETVTDVGTKLPKPAVEIKDTSKIFKDIKAKAWYKQYVDYVVAYGIFDGTSKTEFSPSMNITRAQFVQVLANVSGIDTTNRNVTTGFSDVPAKKWFTPAVKWASENGVVNGMGGGKFQPNANVTREQMCVMLVNYAKYKDITLKIVEEKENFGDDASISKWAKTAVYTCQMADIVNGKGAGKFDPKGTGTRAEASVMFTKFHKDYMK